MRSELHFASKFPEEFSVESADARACEMLVEQSYNIFFSSFEPGELEEIWQRIKSIGPYLVHGHPSTLYQLALHV